MAADNILRTYGDSVIRPSVVGLIEIITAQETQISSMIGKSKAIDMVHYSELDTLDEPGSGAIAQGDDYAAGALSTPSKLGNIVETIAKPIKVTRQQQAVQHFHGENELARQTTKALKNYGNALEFDLVRSTMVSGASGTVAKMAGLIAFISKSTNTTAHTSGTVWSASIMKGLMKDNWSNSNGDVATDVFLGAYLKDATDSFTNKTNTLASSDVKTVVMSVEVFETGLGKLATHAHRYVNIAGTDATGRVLGIRPEKHSVAYLIETFVDNGLSRSGGYDAKAVTGDCTLETRNQDSNFFASGFNIG